MRERERQVIGIALLTLNGPCFLVFRGSDVRVAGVTTYQSLSTCVMIVLSIDSFFFDLFSVPFFGFTSYCLDIKN